MLKQLIQRLLDSRTTPEEAGHSAMPINIANATNLTMDVGAEGSYTAPADGYLSLMVEPGGNINLWGQILPISSFPIQNVQGKLFVPMAKGMEVRYYINGTVSLAKFLKTIGGGYNILVWRAVLCLKPSFNYSLRNFLRISLSGLADKHFHPAGSTSLLPSHSMFRQVTASWDFISRLITLTKRLTYTPIAPAETLSLVPRFQRRQRTATQSLEQSPLRKVTVLLSAVHSLSYGSHQRWEANSNLSTGGALC